ncbi:MAG TPA: FAD:protein FMN transferase, partial [Cyclobacteriaceae bacterium]|nr:FAD:protein FMN transferase [Cyclobacteriaceae bacterium]
MRVAIGAGVICVLFAISGFVIQSHSKKTHQYISNFENVLGTSLELRVTTSSEKEVGRAEEIALAEIDRISKILSAYDQNSEFSRWLKTKDEAIVVAPELFDVLQLFDVWRERTQGALDASAETVSRVWKKAGELQHIPSETELEAAVGDVKQRHWKLDAESRTATHLTNAPLVLNSFAKSYIINKACDAVMADSNVEAIVINIGGDIVVKGNLTEPVELTDPRASTQNDASLDYLKISNRAVATSGNYRRGVKIGDHWYSHIVDPRTGQPVDHIISATVVSPVATDAGALA